MKPLRVYTITSWGKFWRSRLATASGSAPGRSRIRPSSMLPGGVFGSRLRKVSLLVSRLPSAPKEGPTAKRPATRSRLPDTSLSTVRPWRNQVATGPNSLRERSSNNTLPFWVSREALAVRAGSLKRGSLGSKPRARIERVPRVSGLRQSSRFQCTGEIPNTAGSARVCTNRRRGKPAMLIELLVRGLINTKSVLNILCTVTLASNRASRKPSCMNIKMPAKLMPARATASRTG